MMKGVSKQILEITNTENPYFEKVIFFVKPEQSGTSGDKLKKEAQSIASSTLKPPRLKMSKKQIFKITALSLLFTLAGAGITLLINFII